MAIQFTPNEFLSLGSALVTEADYPFTFACWFNSANITTNYILMSTARVGNNNHFMALLAAGSDTGDKIKVGARGSATAANWAITSSGYTANTWHHACGVWAATNDRRAYLDGGNKGTTSTGRSPTSIDEFYIGRRESGLYFDGQIAEAAVWNVALTDDEVASLGNGFRPKYIRPSSLVAYWPCVRWPDNTTGLNDVKGNNLSGSFTAQTDHPRVIG